MKIRECAWCGKAIYGENCYMGTGGYYHKECQLLTIGGHSMSIVTNPDSSTEVMFQELTQLKEKLKQTEIEKEQWKRWCESAEGAVGKTHLDRSLDTLDKIVKQVIELKEENAHLKIVINNLLEKNAKLEEGLKVVTGKGEGE